LKAVQEALSNVRKHARASQVNLTLSFMEDEVILDVQDNGVGFDPSLTDRQAGPEHGYGLVALRERVSQLGGSLAVESAPGEGATLVVSLPVINKEPANQAAGEE
jgi:signal transduction histidine kinase